MGWGSGQSAVWRGKGRIVRAMRTFLNRHPAATVAVVLVLAGLAVASIVYQLRPAREVGSVPARDFYTVDDGETWFVDDADKLTPFDRAGKPAVLVHLYTCDGGRNPFVGYLERLPDGALDVFRARTHFPADRTPEADDVAEVAGSLVKRKGDADWVSSTDFEHFQQITTVRCPAGGAPLQRVFAK